MYANEMCKSTQHTQSQKDVCEDGHKIPHVRRMCLKPNIKYSKSEMNWKQNTKFLIINF